MIKSIYYNYNAYDEYISPNILVGHEGALLKTRFDLHVKKTINEGSFHHNVHNVPNIVGKIPAGAIVLYAGVFLEEYTGKNQSKITIKDLYEQVYHDGGNKWGHVGLLYKESLWYFPLLISSWMGFFVPHPGGTFKAKKIIDL